MKNVPEVTANRMTQVEQLLSEVAGQAGKSNWEKTVIKRSAITRLNRKADSANSNTGVCLAERGDSFRR